MLYVGGALAALDPQGVGEDPMWRLDGQMRFSLFPMLLRPLVATLGAEHAALVVAACGLLLWSAALVVLARVARRARGGGRRGARLRELSRRL